jgi:branched-chain amino acid transport system ATP-binding protein
MLALGCQIIGDPKVMLIDELSLGLAPVVVEAILPVVRRISTELGVGVLLVEQQVGSALAVADRAYVLAHGRLVLEGDAADLRTDPALLESAYLGERRAS